jgi:hypothetical protein
LKKIFIINAKKFGGNTTTLIFALPKRNKGSKQKRESKVLGQKELEVNQKSYKGSLAQLVQSIPIYNRESRRINELESKEIKRGV